MDLLRIASLLTYTFGFYAFGGLLLMWLRNPAPECVTPHGRTESPERYSANSVVTMAMLLLCFAWFGVELGRVLIGLNPVLNSDWPHVPRLVLVYFFPPLIMQLTYLEVQQSGRPLRHRGWRAVLLAGWIVGLAIPAWALLTIFGPLPRPPAMGALLGLSIGAMFALAAIYSSLAMSLGRPRRETADQRSGRRWMLVLYAGLVVLVLLMVLDNWFGAPRFGKWFELIGSSLPLAFIFTSLYHESRFQFFDLFIKRGLFLLLSVALLTVFFGVVFPLLEPVRFEWARPWVLAIALLPVALALPWLHRRLGQWLDNAWLGRRLPPVEAIKRFLADLGRACTHEQLVEEAERGLSAIFGAPVRIHLGLGPAPDTDFEPALDLPIRGDGEHGGVLLIGRRANRMPLFSEDIALAASLADVFSHMLENVRLQERRQEQEQVARELSLQASRSELKALRAQINPHFLFNALNAIAGLIHKDPFRADQTVEQLAEIFRYTLRGSESEWAVLEEELDFVRAYLEVEQARFGRRLQVSVTTEPAVRSARVPTMLIQTLVENAVKHGIAPVRAPGRIEVRASARDGLLVVEVADSGPGFDEGAPRRGMRPTARGGASFGLKNVRERLAGHYGDRARLQIRRDEMTRVRLILPLDSSTQSASQAESGGAA